MNHLKLHPGRTWAPAAALAIALAVGAAACGGAPADDGGVVSLASPSGAPDAPDAPDASAAPAASVDPEEAMLAFQECMKEHGVVLEVAVMAGEAGAGAGAQITGLDEGTGAEPVQPPAPFDPETLAEAEQACRHLLPASGLGGPGATVDPAFGDQLLKFSQCMRDQGVDFPDPQITSSGGVIQAIGGGANLDPSSKAFQDAQAICAKELPGGGTSSGIGGPAVQVAP